MVVTEPIICSIKLDIGNSEVWEWVAFDLIVLSIANEGAFTESFGMLATVLSSATSSLEVGMFAKRLNNLGGERNTRPSGAFGRRWALPVQWSTYCSSRGGGLVFTDRTIAVTKPIFKEHTKLDIENGNRGNGCHLIWQSDPLQMKVPSQNHLVCLQLWF